jgi:hypothetical protein
MSEFSEIITFYVAIQPLASVVTFYNKHHAIWHSEAVWQAISRFLTVADNIRLLFNLDYRLST